MMYHAVIIFAVTISINAFSVNVYDDDWASTNRVEDLGSCDVSFCNTLCQNSGFTDGICVKGNCKCERKERETVQDLSAVTGCVYSACDQLCRRLGFPGGACVGDRCKCDNFLASSDSLDALPELGRCTEQECSSLCRTLAFNSGSCVKDRCQCDKTMEFTNALVAGLGSCHLVECEQRCRRMGFPGGACVNDRCKCDIIQSDEENEVPVLAAQDNINQEVLQAAQKMVSEVNLRSSVSRGSCDCIPRNCDVYCFRIHYTGGICVDGKCRCYK